MKAAMGFRLAQSDFTSDDLEGSKTKVTVFDAKYMENSESYDVEPSGGYIDSSSLDLLPKIFGLLVVTSNAPKHNQVLTCWQDFSPLQSCLFSEPKMQDCALQI